MEIELTPEQDAFVQHLVETGRYQNPAAAIHNAMDLWVVRERARLELIAEIEEGEESAEREGWIDLDSEEAINALFEEIKDNGKAKLAKAG